MQLSPNPSNELSHGMFCLATWKASGNLREDQGDFSRAAENQECSREQEAVSSSGKNTLWLQPHLESEVANAHCLGIQRSWKGKHQQLELCLNLWGKRTARTSSNR